MEIRYSNSLNGYRCPFANHEEISLSEYSADTILTCRVSNDSSCLGCDNTCPLVKHGKITIVLVNGADIL